MTDNIKALKEILELMLVEGDSQRASTVSKTIDFINRQNAEIEKQDAKIEELKYMLECYALQYGTVKGQRKVLNQTRAKAVKELVEIINEKITLFTDEGSEEYASGVNSAFDWYDAKIQESLVDYAKRHSLDYQSETKVEENSLLKEFAQELVDKSVGGIIAAVDVVDLHAEYQRRLKGE